MTTTTEDTPVFDAGLAPGKTVEKGRNRTQTGRDVHGGVGLRRAETAGATRVVAVGRRGRRGGDDNNDSERRHVLDGT